MKNRAIIICLIATILALSSTANAQFSENTNLNRWLRKRPIIDSVDIVGNSFYSATKIKGVMFSRTASFFRTLKSDRRIHVQRETIMRDTSEVKFIYLSAGFLGIMVQEEFFPILPDSGARIVMQVTEGRRFYYDKAVVTGQFDHKFAQRMNTIAARFKKGKPVNPFDLRQAAFDAKTIFANEGYPYASVDYNIDTNLTSDRALITFKATGDSLVHFGHIQIHGMNYYDSSTVLREITFKPGAIYRRSDIIETQKRLLSTGHYLTLQLSPADKDTASGAHRLNPDFVLNLREQKSHYVSIQTGAAQNPFKDLIWDFSAGWGKRNFLHSRRIQFTARTSFVIFTEWRLLSHGYNLQLTEPWFLGLRMPLTLIGDIEPGVRSAVQPYRIQTWSVSLETFRQPTERLKIYTGLEYKSVNIYGLSLADQIALRQEKGIFVRRRLYTTINRDYRDHPFVPTTGSLTAFHFEYAGGFLKGDESYYLGDISWSRYQRVWPGWISATRLKVGNVQAFGSSKEVPIDVRYYLGGANTIRGFSENSLGPQSPDGTPRGANISLIGNQEFRFSLIGKFWGSLFFDMGNGYIHWADIKWTNVALSYGTGIQFISPAGPIRLDYARRIRTKTIEPGYRFHFTILYAF